MSDPRIHIVCQDTSWVLLKLAQHFSKYIPNSNLSSEPDLKANINFYVNWVSYLDIQIESNFDVCWFTHIEDRAKWDFAVTSCDCCVLHGSRYFDTVPVDKRIVFNPPPFEDFLPQRRPRLLVVGREYASGRKNFKVLESLDLELDIQVTEGRLSEDELFAAYKWTDYVLVTSKLEAGPMCVVEAIACNKPVIAPDVGWCWEYPCIHYGSEDDLRSILNNLVIQEGVWGVRVAEFLESLYRIYKETGSDNEI